jgi:hypothetical protein
LELIGLSPNTPAVAIELPPAPAEAEASEPQDEVHVPETEQVLDIQGEDLTMFAGLPLFELA